MCACVRACTYICMHDYYIIIYAGAECAYVCGYMCAYVYVRTCMRMRMRMFVREDERSRGLVLVRAYVFQCSLFPQHSYTNNTDG